MSGYLDGSLGPLRRAQIEAAIRADPKLARTVAAYRAQEEDLRGMAAAVLDEPVPEHLLEVVRQSASPRLAAAAALDRAARRRGRGRSRDRLAAERWHAAPRG